MENDENNDAEDSAVDAGSNQDSLEHEASTSKINKYNYLNQVHISETSTSTRNKYKKVQV